MSEKEVTRRAFLTRASAFGLAAIGSGTILSACGGGDGNGGAASEAPAAEPSQPMAAEPDCSDLSGLTDAELQMRETLAYVEDSPYPEKRCDNCQLYIEPEGDAACGGCQIIKGPIAPQGYCTSWAAKVS